MARVTLGEKIRGLKVGEEIGVYMLGQDDSGRPLFTSRRDVDPEWRQRWDAATADLAVGDRLRGRVSNITNFGAFVDLGSRPDGLIHVSGMPDKMTLAAGDSVDVEIVSIDRDRRRVALRIPGNIHVPAAVSEPAPAEEQTSGRSPQADLPRRHSVRVYEVAKVVGVTNHEVLGACARLGIPARSPSTKLTVSDALRVQEGLTG